VIGDAIGEAGVLGGVTRIGGISYATNFALKPYFTPFPNQRFAGVVSTPSTADIYINGRQVRSVDVPPGVFNLENLPAVSGAGNIRVVLRNAFGQAQELGAPYYMGTQLLRRGLSEFSYTAGFERDPALTGIGSYGQAVVSAHHRYGVNDNFSLGGFAAADKDKVSIGPEATLGLPFGTLSLYGAGSRQAGATDGAASAQYSYQSATFSMGGAYTYTGPRYATLGLDRRDDRAITRIDAFASVPIGAYADLGFDLTHTRFRDAGLSDRASVTASTRLGGRFNLSLTLAHAQVSRVPVDNSVFLALTVALGLRTTATASVAYERRGTTEAVQIQRSLPYGEGLGYLVQGSAGAQAVSLADVQYQGRYGLYEVDVIHTPGNTDTTVSASGALVAIGGRVLPTRPIQDSYALIRVPGLAGVTGTLSHQDVGKTDAQGDLLVPNLLSYYGNELGINDQDIPIAYSVTTTDRVVAPAYRGGAVVAFPVKKLQAFTGTLEVREGDKVIVPAYGDLALTAHGATVESPLGGRGEFYLENPPPSGDATVTYEGGVCRFKMMAPTSTERFVQLGKLICAQP
jgi:outer membrane usher protein